MSHTSKSHKKSFHNPKTPKVITEYIPKTQNSKPTQQKNSSTTKSEEETKTSSQPSEASHSTFYILNTESPLITESLQQIIERKTSLKNVLDIIRLFIKEFNPKGPSNLVVLEEFFDNLDNTEKEAWEKEIFPWIAGLILRTSEIFPEDSQIKILQQGSLEKVYLTKPQCACLLAHMFMCTTSSQNNSKLPALFNFSVIFAGDNYDKNIKIEKIKYMDHYFKRTLQNLPNRSLIFQRLVHQDSIHGKIDLEGWLQCTQELQNIIVSPTGTIEGDIGAIEIDFANRLLGGATLKNASAQEQIQFMTSPELLVGILLCEEMGDKEAILMKGAEIYGKYKGYGHDWRFDGDYEDMREIINEGELRVLDRDIVAIDAINFNWEKKYRQFSEEAVLRELNKAYVGFKGEEGDKGIVTGKWGCGIFWGDVQLKLLIQWIAASRAGREMRFYSFGEDKDLKDVKEIVEEYKEKEIGGLVGNMMKACKEIDRAPGKQKPQVFSLLKKTIKK